MTRCRMDISGLLSRTLQSAGDRLLNWMSQSGVEVRVEYHAGNVHYERVLTPRERDNEEPAEPADGARTLIRLGAAIGSAVIVGTAVAAAGIMLAAPDLIGAEPMPHNTDAIESRCGTTVCRGDEPDTCPVCMESYKKGELLMILPCMHKYHKGCIMPWLLQSGLCSVCRFNVLDSGYLNFIRSATYSLVIRLCSPGTHSSSSRLGH